MKIGRVTISRRAIAGIHADLSGPEIERILRETFGMMRGPGVLRFWRQPSVKELPASEGKRFNDDIPMAKGRERTDCRREDRNDD